MAEIHLHYLNHARRPGARADRRTRSSPRSKPACWRRAAARRRSSRACTSCRRRTTRATSTCCAATSGRSALAGVKVVGDYYRQLRSRPAVGAGAAQPVRPEDRHAGGDHRRDRHHRHAHRRGHRDRRQAPGAQGQLEGARPHRRARHRRTGTCACSTRIFDFDEIRVHSRRPESRDAFAARLERDLGKTVIVTEDWESCVRGADIVVEASRLEKPAAAAQDRVDQEGRLRRSLRHDERGRALAHRHHGQDGDGRLGPGARPGRSARCARTSTAAGCREQTCTPSWARSSPASSPAARATTRRSCSGTAACRCPTSRSAQRCCEKAKRMGIGQRLRFR